MLRVADFFDNRKVGNVGPLGFRRSSDLRRLLAGIDELQEQNTLKSSNLNFLDMGCGDGRVNILFSYISNKSIGIELDEWTLDDYTPIKKKSLRMNLTNINQNYHLTTPIFFKVIPLIQTSIV